VLTLCDDQEKFLLSLRVKSGPADRRRRGDHPPLKEHSFPWGLRQKKKANLSLGGRKGRGRKLWGLFGSSRPELGVLASIQIGRKNALLDALAWWGGKKKKRKSKLVPTPLLEREKKRGGR